MLGDETASLRLFLLVPSDVLRTVDAGGGDLEVGNGGEIVARISYRIIVPL